MVAHPARQPANSACALPDDIGDAGHSRIAPYLASRSCSTAIRNLTPSLGYCWVLDLRLGITSLPQDHAFTVVALGNRGTSTTCRPVRRARPLGKATTGFTLIALGIGIVSDIPRPDVHEHSHTRTESQLAMPSMECCGRSRRFGRSGSRNTPPRTLPVTVQRQIGLSDQRPARYGIGLLFLLGITNVFQHSDHTILARPVKREKNALILRVKRPLLIYCRKHLRLSGEMKRVRWVDQPKAFFRAR